MVEVTSKLAELRVPLVPLLLRSEKAVPHVAKEFHLHNVHLLHRNARYFSPGLVCIRIVVQKLVPEHQSNSQESELTAWFALDCRVGLLETVHEKQGKQDDVLRHLCRGQNRGDPFSETNRWSSVWD